MSPTSHPLVISDDVSSRIFLDSSRSNVPRRIFGLSVSYTCGDSKWRCSFKLQAYRALVVDEVVNPRSWTEEIFGTKSRENGHEDSEEDERRWKFWVILASAGDANVIASGAKSNSALGRRLRHFSLSSSLSHVTKSQTSFVHAQKTACAHQSHSCTQAVSHPLCNCTSSSPRAPLSSLAMLKSRNTTGPLAFLRSRTAWRWHGRRRVPRV